MVPIKQVNSTTAVPMPGSPNEQIAVDSTWTVSGLAMGTDYHFLYKVIQYMIFITNGYLLKLSQCSDIIGILQYM